MAAESVTAVAAFLHLTDHAHRADVCATCCSLLAGCHLRSGAQLDMYVVAEQQAIDGML
jgi:hypothetical protein